MAVNLMKRFWYEEIDSTMNEAKRLIQDGEIKDNAFIVADCQTSGRGTHGRRWVSPKGGGIYLSIVHLPKKGEFFKATTLYTLACGAACIEAIKEVCGIQATLKPVNDIYVNGKKLGGILVESTLHKQGISALITGVGINTHKATRVLDDHITLPISIEELLSPGAFSKFSKEALTEAIVSKTCLWYELVF